MSGIYIPNIKPPQDGDFELWISIKKDGSYNYNINGGWNKGKQKVIPVPKHGRLIDADTLEDNNITYYAIPVLANITDAAIREAELVIRLKDLDAAPTIIPANLPKEK